MLTSQLVVDRVGDDRIYVSDIAQINTIVPDDFEEACLMCVENPGGCPYQPHSCEFPIDALMYPSLPGCSRGLGYAVHAHCWVLVERAIGRALVESNLQVFKQALLQFWDEQEDGIRDLVCPEPDPEDTNSFNPISSAVRYNLYGGRYRNPANVPEIRRLVEQATQTDIHDGPCHQKPSGLPQVPLEIAMMIVDAIYYDNNYNAARIEDTQNLLVAFQWTLPDTYWQSRCYKDLIFEVKDLIEGDISVNWQSLCLVLEGLLVDHEWYSMSGLGNRARIFQMLKRIKVILLHLLE
jgi:hypothetical protein